MTNKILVIGGGGREHSLICKLKESEYVRKIYSIPGNDGMAAPGGISKKIDVINIALRFNLLKDFVREKEIDFILVGPEQPLVDGITDYFESEKITVFGPHKKAAQLEGSKIFAKNFMKKYNIPTADFEIFSDSKKAMEYTKNCGESECPLPLVIKADGLCGGKGVIVCDDEKTALDSIKKIMDSKVFNDAGNRIIIEEKLIGEEASVIILMAGENYTFLLPSQDHKPLNDGDMGPNTGGMGAYAPTSLITKKILKKIDTQIVKPVVEGIKREGMKYYGVLYIGLMLVDNSLYVLEFNVRFGDPETQAILPLMDSDLMEIFLKIKSGEKTKIKWKNGFCVNVVLASEGYPGTYKEEIKITMPDSSEEEVFIFHSGTVYKNNSFWTAGGRVLSVSATGQNINTARSKVYNVVSKINFNGMHFRKDIAKKEVDRSGKC